MEETGQEQTAVQMEDESSGAPGRWSKVWQVLIMLAALGLTTVFNIVLEEIILPSSLVFTYLVATIAGAIFFGIWAAVLAFVGGFLIFNFLFVEPFYTLFIADPEDLYNLIFYFALAVLITYLISIVRRQNAFLKDRLDRVTWIEEMSEDYLRLNPVKEPGKALPQSLLTSVLNQLGGLAIRHVRMFLNVPSMVLFRGPDGKNILAKSSIDQEVTESDLRAAEWTMDCGEPCGSGTHNQPDQVFSFFPIASHSANIGALGIRYDYRQLFPEQRRLLRTICNMAAMTAARWVDLSYEPD